jgi:cell division septation protein DedD
VPNQDELIFDRNRGARPAAQGGLAPEAETPRVDQLRAQLAERAAQEAARNAPPPSPAPAQPAASTAPRGAPQAAAPSRPAPPATNSALNAPSLPAPVPSAERFAPVPNGRAQVQLGALPSEAAARGEWDRLQKRVPEFLGNRRVSLAPFDREGQTTLYRIRTGGFADAATARAFCEEMKTKSIPCMVVGG